MNDWHIPDESLVAFSADPGEMGDAAAASIEQHLTACAECQAALAALAPQAQLDAIWAEVQDGVDRAGIGFVERRLAQLGFESGPARLMAATPALRVGAVLAVGLIVAAVVLVSRAADAGEAFLALAPVVPTALVGLSFAPGADPAGECGLATPVFGFGLVIRRALGIELVALFVLAVGSLFVPIDGLRALGWLLPALALSIGTLAGGVRWSAPTTASALTAGWVGALVVAQVSDSNGSFADSVVFDTVGQTVLALMVTVAILVAVTNRQVLFQEVKR